MSETSHISWTDATFNPWWGCVKVSPACDNCYAERDSRRYGFSIWGKDSPRRFFSDKHWMEPRKWGRVVENGIPRRRRVFCASMADILEDREDLKAPRRRLFECIEATQETLTWLLLSKRAMNYEKMLPESWCINPLPNVWIGTTVESPEYFWRIDAIKRMPAVVHFLSMEPLTAPVPAIRDHLSDIEWVISGGESGGFGARPTPADWFRQIRDAAVSREIPFHFKQWGEHNADLVRIGKKKAGCELDGREWKEFPR